jgi:hypothetical protein
MAPPCSTITILWSSGSAPFNTLMRLARSSTLVRPASDPDVVSNTTF